MELFTPDFGLIFWMFVAFAILFLILYKWGWPAILKGVESRADLIDKGVEYAQSAKEQLDHAKEQADAAIAEARKQQADMLREADRMKTQIIEEARDAAKKEAAKVMDAAKVSIAQERKEAEKQFRNEVSAFALDIAAKVVKGEMADKAQQKKLVDSLLNDMEKQN
ncbi:MAG: F0F1 ATP synthase subunit B [Paramuribaculum sp.]|nr:F0F1 ATP synthase subunit B [Paramuribaculum sp.]MDE6459679.1 F0F1 ATP synthase subunit B [Paramuribaculum sp.]MDE6651133.1 F0F1 ATP synthase subunit B [Paramuribaculum sp.]